MLGLKEKAVNGANVQTLEGTTNTLPCQMGDGSATAQGQPFVPDGRNNAETGGPKKTVFSFSDEDANDLDAAYGAGAFGKGAGKKLKIWSKQILTCTVE